MNVSFSDLLALVGSGVTLHNVLRFAATKLTTVATDVQSGNVRALAHDAKGVVDFVQAHDPALAKAVAAEADRLKAAAAAEVDRVRHDAADELRKLAAAVEKAAGSAPSSASAPATVIVNPADAIAPAPAPASPTGA